MRTSGGLAVNDPVISGTDRFSLTVEVERDTLANVGTIIFADGPVGRERRSFPIGSAEDGLFCILDIGTDGQLLSLELLNFDQQTAGMDLQELPEKPGGPVRARPDAG
ncbi:MAG TPA: hypothetical protein PKV13_04640 [Propionicimonas sp.]|nr:hypothetical protein [Propionicimonas sp.]HRA05889.1 hypothetical protein [Propionicimonas sp.]